MNVDASVYVRPPLRGETATHLETEGPHRLLARPGGQALEIQHLFRAGTTLSSVFQQSVLSMVDLFAAGFNIGLLVTGESGSGKSYAVAGENLSGTGFVPMIMDALFKKIRQDERLAYSSSKRSDAQVTLEMYEVYNELVRDLLQPPSITQKYLGLDETPNDAVHVKNGSVAPVRDEREGETLFRQAWSRRSDHYTDFGPAKNYSAVLIHLELVMTSGESPLPNKSRFTVVVTPGLEKVAEDSRQLRVREGPTLSKGMVSLSQLTAALANQPYADRVINYSESMLTSLLRDELGGNSKTCVLLCLKPHTDQLLLDPVLRFVSQCTQVKNFPILNDPFAQQLLTQYRAHIVNLKQQLGYSTGLVNPGKGHDTSDELRRLQNENVTLRDQNDRLQERLDHLHAKFGTLATTKTDLSSQLLMTEEEKLKVSKTLVEMQIDNNKLREEMEAAKFELTNKILQLESDLTQLEVDRDKHSRSAMTGQERLSALERDRKDLADEYVGLKANYSSLKGAHDREVKKNEELSVELLNLVNAKAALVRRLDKLESGRGRGGEEEEELERVRAIVSRMSARRPENHLASEEEKQRTGFNLFGSQSYLEKEIKALRNQHEEEIKKYDRRLMTMKKEVHESRNVARERQRKISQINARLILVKAESDHLQNQNNKLQHKMKNSTDDFRSRLVKYVEDIAQYMDSRGDSVRSAGQEQMGEYVQGMLSDLRKAHKVREEQLSQAAHGYRQRLKEVTQTHEQILIAHRELRLKLAAGQNSDLDLGPDEYELSLSDPEFTSAHQKEIDHLKDQLDRAVQQIESLRLGLNVDDLPDIKTTRPSGPDREKSWSSLRRQLRTWSESTQQELEQERARLLTTTAVLEEENSELRAYIDTHLKRYKEEITRLRQMLGVTDTGGFDSPGPLGDRLGRTRRR